MRERVDRFGRNRYVSDMADGRAVTKLHLNFNPQKECLVEREREKLSVFVLNLEIEITLTLKVRFKLHQWS